MSTHVLPRRWLAAAALAAALAAAGCGDETPDVDDSGAVGPDEPVSESIEVLQVQLEYPLDDVYEEGEDARLFLGIANPGTEEDDLIDVRGPDFTDAALTVDGEAAVIRVLPEDNVFIGPEGAPSIVLEDLQTTLRSSQSIPVTFVFEEAGEVTVDAVVAVQGQDPTPPVDAPDPTEDPTG